MINLIKLQCPNCNANLEIKEDAKFCFCTYCGTKIMLSNENEHIYRIVDEARMKEAELNYDLERRRIQQQSDLNSVGLEQKKLERDIALAQAYGEYDFKEKEKEVRRKSFGKKILFGFLTILAFFIFGSIIAVVSEYPIWILISLIGGCYVAFTFIPKAVNNKMYNKLGYSVFPKVRWNLKEYPPTLLELDLESAGFYNIDMQSLHDLKSGLFHSETERIERILIDGSKAIPGKPYPSDSPITIVYHGK